VTGNPPLDPRSRPAADDRTAARAELRRLLAAFESEPGVDEASSQAAGRELFRALPRLGPAAGFADRVVARLAPRAAWSRAWVRGGLAAALAAAALALAILGPLALPLVSWIGPGGAIDLVVGGFADLVGRLAEVLSSFVQLACCFW
jgi:hypothetical protein